MFTSLKMNIEEIIYEHGNVQDHFTKLARAEYNNRRVMVELRFFRAKSKPSLIERQHDMTINEILRHVQETFLPNVKAIAESEFTPAQIINFEPKRSVKHGADFAQFLAIRQYARSWYGVEEAFRTKMQLAFFGDTAMLYTLIKTGESQVRVEILVAAVEWPTNINVSKMLRTQWEEDTVGNIDQPSSEPWYTSENAEVHRTELLLEAIRRNLLTSYRQVESLSVPELHELFKVSKQARPSKVEYASLLNWRLSKTLLPISELRWLLVKHNVLTYSQAQALAEPEARSLLISSVDRYLVGIKNAS